MWRTLCVVALCTLGLTACGSEPQQMDGELRSVEQGLACEYPTGACPGSTVCAWEVELCRPACVNGGCAISNQICCTQPTGAPYCNTFCF
ncbi:hypothetical protein LY474_35995 [Myxococcus stipitatus]|uniref:hypothetical protein n=1 Tax=Myxococcus stipitatus TaxID=83455 RepID=UPI001F387D54|nr:hypothetical protein [Myxococcus stipitatus]MCE9673224.1 hypothetical protein [Myxococcus stipitatus]